MQHLRAIAILCTSATAGLLAAGCGKPLEKESLGNRVRNRIRSEGPTLDIQMSGNDFSVDDEQGRKLIEAAVENVDGKVVGGGLDGPVKLNKAKCKLYREGKLEFTLDTPQATWDGKKLISEKPLRAVTAKGDKVIDAEKGAWTASNNQLDLERAKLQSMAGKKVEMTAEAPKAVVLNKIATMAQGGIGRNPDGDQMTASQCKWHFEPQRIEGTGSVILTNTDGGRLTTNSLKWTIPTGKVEADGNVVLTDEGTRVTGQRLRADTKLKRGRLSGATRVVMTKGLPLKSLPGKKARPKALEAHLVR
jgi:hypothetical protein